MKTSWVLDYALQPIIFNWRQNSSRSVYFAYWGKI